MPRGTKIMLSFADWPAEDQERWQQALKPTDRFEESSLGAHLAQQPEKQGGKVMGGSLDSSRFSSPSGLVMHQRRELIARLWPNTSPGAERQVKYRRLVTISKRFVMR